MCIFNLMNIGVLALLSNSHYYISELVLEKFQKENNIKLDDENQKYFKSGSVMADIGRFDMDKTQIQTNDNSATIVSDSKEFTKKLLEVAKINNSEHDIWYALGACIHCVQDQYTKDLLNSLQNFDTTKELDDSKKNYFKYGIVENYFYDKLRRAIICENLSENFDLSQTGKELLTDEEIANYRQYIPLFFKIYFRGVTSDNLLLNENLMVQTYKELGIEVTAERLRNQAANLIGSSAILSYISTHFIKESDVNSNNTDELQHDTNYDSLASSIDSLVNLCVAELQQLVKDIDFNDSRSNTVSNKTGNDRIFVNT